MEKVGPKVTKLWKIMPEVMNVRPNLKTYTSLIYSYIKSSRSKEACLTVEPLIEYFIQRCQDRDRRTRLE